jgi:hypothetical protein
MIFARSAAARILLGLSLICLATAVAGWWRMHQSAAMVGATGDLFWSRELQRWLAIMVATAVSVLICSAVFEFASRHRLRWLSWAFVPLACVLLLAAGSAALVGDRHLLREGWHTDPDRFAVYWPLWAGGAVLLLLALLRRGTSIDARGA